jgi:hypothetical protein
VLPKKVKLNPMGSPGNRQSSQGEIEFANGPGSGEKGIDVPAAKDDTELVPILMAELGAGPKSTALRCFSVCRTVCSVEVDGVADGPSEFSRSSPHPPTVNATNTKAVGITA